MTVGIVISAVLFLAAAHFAWRQRVTLATLRFDTRMPPEQRHYLLKQCQRRTFGSVLLFVLAGMMIGSLFLDFKPHEGAADPEAARRAVRLLSIYFISMLMVLMVILILAIVDFWATARYSFQQRKRLLQEHQDMLEADLWEYRHREPDSDS